jgi:flagellar hook protein FlgE
MKSFQTRMDTIANNIANVNTTAYKSSRARFQDMLSQTTVGAQGPQDGGRGGVNPQQVGLGVKLGSIDAMMENGALQATNRNLDFAIEGNGFFTVAENFAGVVPMEPNFTRDGAFFIDSTGHLVNANGQKVLGYTADQNGNLQMPGGAVATGNLRALTIPTTRNGEDLQVYGIDASGTISAVYGTNDPVVIGRFAVTTFATPEGLEKKGSNNYIATANSGNPRIGVAGDAGVGAVRQGFLEMSNVDLANEFTEMVIASRAYTANSRSITTSDEMLQDLINLKR